jgi:hypothetical protein
MDTITLLLLGALSTARLTRLVTTDRITQAPRNWAIRKLPEHSLIAYLLVCGWCVSMYTGAAVAVLGAAYGMWSWPEAVLAALAFSYTAGWLASWEGME